MYVSSVLNPPKFPGGKWWVECKDDDGMQFVKEFDEPHDAITFMEKARDVVSRKILADAGIKKEIFDGKVTPRRPYGPFGSGAT